MVIHRAAEWDKRIQYLEENIASENVKLTAAGLESNEAMMPADIVWGTCYSETSMNTFGR